MNAPSLLVLAVIYLVPLGILAGLHRQEPGYAAIGAWSLGALVVLADWFS